MKFTSEQLILLHDVLNRELSTQYEAIEWHEKNDKTLFISNLYNYVEDLQEILDAIDEEIEEGIKAN